MDTNANTNHHTTECPAIEEDNLSGYFQRSATLVRQYADLIEQDYARPLLRCASIRFKEMPVTMTFLSIYGGLSALPLLSFIGLSVFAFSTIAFLGFIFAAFTFLTVQAFLAVCLVLMLWSLFIVAGFVTVVVVFVYWIMRLGVIVTREGPTGVTDWAEETRQYVFYTKRREPTEESDESAVFVDKDGPSSKKIKVEEDSPLGN